MDKWHAPATTVSSTIDDGGSVVVSFNIGVLLLQGHSGEKGQKGDSGAPNFDIYAAVKVKPRVYLFLKYFISTRFLFFCDRCVTVRFIFYTVFFCLLSILSGVVHSTPIVHTVYTCVFFFTRYE